MTPEVENAVLEIRRTFPGHEVTVEPEQQGGAYVFVHDLELGKGYSPATSWVGFLIDFQYPRSDVYPHFLDPGIQRTDGKGHGDGISGPTNWHERSALQISRKSNRWNPATDSAAAKLIKVLEWFTSR